MESLALIPTSSGSTMLTRLLIKFFFIILSFRERKILFKVRSQACWSWIYRSGNGRSSTTLRRWTNEGSQGYCTGNKHNLWPELDLIYSVPVCKALWNLGKRSDSWSGSTIAAAQRGQVGRVSRFCWPILHENGCLLWLKYYTKTGRPRLDRGHCKYQYA